MWEDEEMIRVEECVVMWNGDRFCDLRWRGCIGLCAIRN